MTTRSSELTYIKLVFAAVAQKTSPLVVSWAPADESKVQEGRRVGESEVSFAKG